MIESKRGCGLRHIGALYLCGNSIWTGCDRIPFPVKSCPVCGEGIHFPRSLKQVNPVKLFGSHLGCRDNFVCRVCAPQPEPVFLLGVGEKFYTPEEFIFEAQTMGVSKRIHTVPKTLKSGESWVYLIHRKGITTETADKKVRHQMAIIGAFVPARLEMLLHKADATPEKVGELAKRHITVVVVPDDDHDHD